ncbi:MAG: hypothetical protein ABW221_23155 [Vicinamibacteria bacterium]
MKDAVVTVRLPSALRRRILGVARKEGRSLSAQIERLVEAGLAAAASTDPAPPKPPALSGLFAGGRVPSLADFKDVRASLSGSLRVRKRG